MLDQNTDRMWYVIGAVIVGAALIFIVNSSFPQVFASVGSTFQEKVEDVTGIIIGSDANIIDYDVHTIRRGVRVDGVGVYAANPSGYWYSTVENVPVKENTKYIFSAKDGISSPIVSYFDKDNVFLGNYGVWKDNTGQILFVTPPHTTNVRLSAGDVTILPSMPVSKIEDWKLKEAGI